MYKQDGGTLEQCFFAGLPESCQLIQKEHQALVKCFIGSESAYDTLIQLGVNENEIPKVLIEGSKYDEELRKLAKDMIELNEYKQ